MSDWIELNRTTTTTFEEMFWDCPECGHMHISYLSPTGQRCPKCCYHRQAHILGYTDNTSRVFTKEEVQPILDRPPFWICKHCDAEHPDSGRPAQELYCDSCGFWQISQEDEDGDGAADTKLRRTGGNVIETLTITADNISSDDHHNGLYSPELQERMKQQQERHREFQDQLFEKSPAQIRAEQERKRAPHVPRPNIDIDSNVILIAAVVCFAIGSVGLIGYAGRPVDTAAEVSHLYWTGRQGLEEYQTLSWSGWESNRPFGFRETYRERRQSGTRLVEDGYKTERYTDTDCKKTDTGRGVAANNCTTVTKERQVKKYKSEPTYDWYVTGNYDTWVNVKNFNNEGIDDDPRVAPGVLEPGTLQRRLTTATFDCNATVTFQEGKRQGQTENLEVTCSQYDTLEPKDDVTFHRGWFGIGNTVSLDQ